MLSSVVTGRLCRAGIVPFFCVAAGAAWGQGAIESDVEGPVQPWTHLNFQHDGDTVQFAVVADNAGGPRWGRFAEAMDKLNLLYPDFVMSVGDFVEGYEDTEAALHRQWDAFEADLSRLHAPFFFVPGNHDNGKPLWDRVYRERIGPTHYSFVYKDVLFLILCTNDGPDNGTGISAAQAEYAARVLEAHRDVRWTFIFQHKPLWNYPDDSGWSQIAPLIEGRRCTLFAGHTHTNETHHDDTSSFVTLGVTGGGSALRGVDYGEFDQIAWVTFDGEAPSIAILEIDGIHPADVVTPEKAGALSAFREGTAVTAAPIAINAVALTEGATALTVKNPAQTPLRFKALIETQAGVRAEPSTVEGVIPPGEALIRDIRVTADRALPIGQVQPVMAHWTAHYDAPGWRLEGRTAVPIDGRNVCPPAPRPVSVDGRLDEWDELPYDVRQPASIYTTPTAWRGPTDGRFRFGTAYDAAYVYIAIEAHDNEALYDGWKYWTDFALMVISPSAVPDPRAVFGIIAAPAIPEGTVEEYQPGSLPDGAHFAAVETDTGFTAEVAIPAAHFNAHQDGAWEQFRLNIGFSDFDRSDSAHGVTILFWRPQWERGGFYPASGLFVRGE